MSFAEVAVDAPIRSGRTFTYEVPLQISALPGQMVQVPFGPSMADGIVFEVSEVAKFLPARPIQVVDTFGPLLEQTQLDLARWISKYYMTSLFSAAALMLPPQFRNRTRSFISLSDRHSLSPQSDLLSEHTIAILQSRPSGRVAEGILLEAIKSSSDQSPRRTIDRMVRTGILARSWTWRMPRIPSALNESNAEHADPETPLAPTSAQSVALEEIKASLKSGRHAAVLLSGVTGSGKTEVYLQAIARCLDQGQGAIVLVPEISLTPQTMQRFQARFPGRVAVLHSGLSAAEHRRTWWAIRSRRYQVVVGPRSALFAPVGNLGLIVVDEEHEWTYKQQEIEPRYHARTVALYLAQLAMAVVVLGSATPDVVTYHRAISGRRLGLFELPQRVGIEAKPRPLANVKIVDMRRELSEGNRSIFSRALQEALLATIDRGEQAILFINRRGTAGVVQCRDCGHALRCRGCDTPLTYHAISERLLCHQCNRNTGLPERCPSCRSRRIRYLGVGTQRVVTDLQQLIPGVSVLRWDRDAVSSPPDAEPLLERFVRGEVQVLVGTQMVAKGLHIEAVTLVGVILADVGLHLPDFRAAERVFQLLCQVAGRAGRGTVGGTAIVQTYRPDQYAVAAAVDQDYPGFYQQEIDFRRSQKLPPFTRLIHLVFAHTNAGRCQGEAERLARVLRQQRDAWAISEVDLIGPAPAYPARLRGRYRWHLILRGPDPRLLLDKIQLPSGWVLDVDPVSVL